MFFSPYFRCSDVFLLQCVCVDILEQLSNLHTAKFTHFIWTMIFSKFTELDKHHYSSILGHFYHPCKLPQAHSLSVLYRVLSYGTLDIIFCFSRSSFDTLPRGVRSWFFLLPCGDEHPDSPLGPSLCLGMEKDTCCYWLGVEFQVSPQASANTTLIGRMTAVLLPPPGLCWPVRFPSLLLAPHMAFSDTTPVKKKYPSVQVGEGPCLGSSCVCWWGWEWAALLSGEFGWSRDVID